MAALGNIENLETFADALDEFEEAFLRVKVCFRRAVSEQSLKRKLQRQGAAYTNEEIREDLVKMVSMADVQEANGRWEAAKAVFQSDTVT